MKKIILVKSENLITWKSCKSISANIVSSYMELHHKSEYKVESVIFNETYKYKAIQTVQQILAAEPDAIAFIDHFPHPGGLIEMLLEAYRLKGQKTLPELIIYAYGDFTMNFKWWNDCEESLNHFPVRFFAASKKQKDLISKMTLNPNHTHHVSYPVEKAHFHYDAKKRSETRTKLGLKENDFVFLYTGRLSRQKSILELTQIFSAWSQNVAPNAYLFLAGDFDDLGVPYLNKRDEFNQYFTEYQNLLAGLTPEIRNRIRYLGNFSYTELPYLYNAADTYISLSVHNDEDFGMAPAEAASCGLPMILNDWGGLSSFKLPTTDSCDLVPVNIGRGSIHFDPEVVGKLLFKKLARPATAPDRQAIAKHYADFLSIEAVAQKMDGIYQQAALPFEGFNDLFKEISDKATMGNHGLFSRVTVEFNQLYRNVYESYL